MDLEERAERLMKDYFSISSALRDDISKMTKGYRPCEDCLYFHQYMNAVLSKEEKPGKYCSLHDWDESAEIFKVKEILGCRKENWRDYYGRTIQDLRDMKIFMRERLKK